MRSPLAVCRNGHRMSGANLLWHTRYDGDGNPLPPVRECRACVNARYRNRRKAVKRNLELQQQALLAASQSEDTHADYAHLP